LAQFLGALPFLTLIGLLPVRARLSERRGWAISSGRVTIAATMATAISNYCCRRVACILWTAGRQSRYFGAVMLAIRSKLN